MSYLPVQVRSRALHHDVMDLPNPKILPGCEAYRTRELKPRKSSDGPRIARLLNPFAASYAIFCRQKHFVAMTTRVTIVVLCGQLSGVIQSFSMSVLRRVSD